MVPNDERRVDPISRLEELNTKERLSTAERKEQKQLSNWGNSGMTRLEAYKLLNAAMNDVFRNTLKDIGRHSIRLSAIERVLIDKGVMTMKDYEGIVEAVRLEIMEKYSNMVLAKELEEAKNQASEDGAGVDVSGEAQVEDGGEPKSSE